MMHDAKVVASSVGSTNNYLAIASDGAVSSTSLMCYLLYIHFNIPEYYLQDFISFCSEEVETDSSLAYICFGSANIYLGFLTELLPSKLS